MLKGVARGLFGSANERSLKRLSKTVEEINAVEPELEKLSDDELNSRTGWLRGRLQGGESLDDLLVDAFATVREASKRTLGQRHFDVQLLGGMVLHDGKISEMKTGEGKTIVAPLACYVACVEGLQCHVVTTNDYLVQRDRDWAGLSLAALTLVSLALGLALSAVVMGLWGWSYAAPLSGLTLASTAAGLKVRP